MGSAMHIGVIALVVVADGIYDDLGFLGCGSIVQIDQRLATALALQYRKVVANAH